MQCIRPIKAGFDEAGNLVYSIKKFSKALVPFEFPCRKCLPCRLNIAREKAIRCTHEAKMHENNIFLTLTYDEKHLVDGRLHYTDIQTFFDSLRKKLYRSVSPENRDLVRIGFMVTGEYGDKNKRPHWHAIIFNYRPADAKYKYSTDLGEKVYSSVEISNLWQKGNIEFGSVTMDSAGYVARYAAKKLSHGKDDEHDFHPIHKTSSKNAIGKSWIEKYYRDVFAKGFVLLPNGQKAGIPRYYVDWFRKNHPEQFLHYLVTVKKEAVKTAEENARRDELEYLSNCMTATGGHPLTKKGVKHTILKGKFKQLQERLKL